MFFQRSAPSQTDVNSSEPAPGHELAAVETGPSSQTSTSLRRPCGWYERLFVSTSHTGEPLYATFVARIEKPYSEVNPATHKRVEELIDQVALLSAKVTESRTRTPWFEVPDERRKASDVMFTQSCIPGTRDEIREDVHARAVQYAEDTFGLEEGKLWNVGLWTPAGNGDREGEKQQQLPEENFTYLSLTILHLAADGLGGRFLFESLISPTIPAHIKFLPGLPPTLEDSLGYKLQGKMIRHIAWVIFSLLMPKPIRYWMTWAPHWPLKVEAHPSTQPTARKIFLLEGSIVPKLKEVAKANGLGTVNPVMSIGALAALFSVTAPPDAVDSDKRLPFHLALETPIALREPEKLQHSSCAGNFSGAHLHQAQLRRTTPFWDHAREYSDAIKGLTTNDALQFLALSKLVPDPKNYKPTEESPTPWDAYVRGEMKKPQPHRSSLDLVNLGAIHGPKNGRVSEISISGTIDQTYSAFMLVCGGFISHDADIPSQMTVTIAWRRNCLRDELVADFVSNFRKMLTLIVAGRIDPSTTFGQVAEMLGEEGLEEWRDADFEGAKAKSARGAVEDAAAVEVLKEADGSSVVEGHHPSSGTTSRSASVLDASSTVASTSTSALPLSPPAIPFENRETNVVEKSEMDSGTVPEVLVPVLASVGPGYQQV
ncbi:hypothetical protein A4X13_0g7058 [Tilletia indica]|uniref:Uncharacterized protein n=1 Tax=Tilletia indica TaxID=43049 RepID=A0A177TM90_9BASI|nr:hypothetical protein A4X13_0g7058 [Tilletia indica]